MSTRAAERVAARERIAEIRRTEAQRGRRRRRLAVSVAAVATVVVVLAVLVLAKATGLGGAGSGEPRVSSAPASAAVLRAVTSVPAVTLDRIGAGSAQSVPRRISAPALTADGKPKVLYVGAEYCPFCAVERWPLIVALSRFGTWSGLAESSSGSADIFPNTPTLSFHGARYVSDYLSFTGVETQTNQVVNGSYAPLDQLSADDQRIFDTYGRPPYTRGDPGSIPFLDIAGRYANVGATYSPTLLQGRSREQIAASLKDPHNPTAVGVGGAANVLTAAICEATGHKPASVCTSPGVRAGAAHLAHGQSQ